MKKNLFNVFLVCVFCVAAIPDMFAQQIKVTGKVTDSTNEGMPGVNVQVKGTATGTITDFDGNYSIDVPDSKSTLVFSFIGYVTQQVPVGGKKVLNVQLKDDTQTLDEVVVVAYGTARKSDLTGATASLRPDANDASKTASFNNLLQGKVAGLNVTSSMAAPGAASSVTIRGANSLRGDNQPLYVIDNVPQSSTGEFAESAMGGGDFQIAHRRLVQRHARADFIMPDVRQMFEILFLCFKKIVQQRAQSTYSPRAKIQTQSGQRNRTELRFDCLHARFFGIITF